MERFSIDDAIKQSKIVANRYKWSAENADMGSEDANELNADICNRYVKEYRQIAKWLEEFKSYKQAEEQGLLVRLPCKVGTEVYYILGIPNKTPCTIDKCVFKLSDVHKIGESLFLTREEAEKKLEEMKKNGK